MKGANPNSWAISHVSGILPTVYSGVQVIFTVAFASAFLGEELGWDRALGSAVTVAGVALVSREMLREGRESRVSLAGAGAGGGSGGGDGGDVKWSRGGGDGGVRTSIDGIDVVVSLGDDDRYRGGGGGNVDGGEALLDDGGSGSGGFGEVEMAEVPLDGDGDDERDGAPLLGASILQSLPRDPPTPLRSFNR